MAMHAYVIDHTHTHRHTHTHTHLPLELTGELLLEVNSAELGRWPVEEAT